MKVFFLKMNSSKLIAEEIKLRTGQTEGSTGNIDKPVSVASEDNCFQILGYNLETQ